jgi:hypothetical protein
MDTIDLTKGRQEKFQNDQYSKKDLLRNREIKMLELRKAGVNDRINKTRNFQKIDDSKYEIKVESLLIGNDLTDNYFKSNHKVDDIFIMLENNEENIRKFAIKQLSYLSDALEENKSLINSFNQDYFNKILKFLVQTKDMNEIYEFTFIIINITRFSGEFVEHIAHSRYISQIFDQMELILDPVILNHYLIIFGNLLGESENTSQIILKNCKIIESSQRYLNSTNLPLYLKTSLFFLISNITKYIPITDIRDIYLTFLPIFANNLKSSLDNENFNYNLKIIKVITDKSAEEDLKEILKNKIHILLLSHIKQEIRKDNMELIFRILTNLINISLDDNFIDDLYSKNMFNIIETYLECINFSSSSKECSKMLLALTIFLDTLIYYLGDGYRSSLIRRTKIPTLLIKLIEQTPNLDIAYNILSFFKIALDSNTNNIKTDLLRIPLLEVFCRFIKTHNFEIQLVCLEGIYLFLRYGENLMKDKRNIVTTHLELSGETYEIQKLISSNNDGIAKLAESINNTYFSNMKSSEVENA